MFYVLVSKGEDFEVQWVNSTRCNEFYKDYLDADDVKAEERSQFDLEFDYDKYVCPDVSEIKL